MGLFSWNTQDTDRSIPCTGASRATFTVTMTDNKGNKWTERAYEGYGEFGGKDYYELLAEMNGAGTDRDAGVTLAFSNREDLVYPNLTENPNWKWVNEEPKSCSYQGYFYPEDEEAHYWGC